MRKSSGTCAVLLGLALVLVGSPAVTARDYSDHQVVLGIAETITDPASGESGRVEYFRKDVGNGQLSHDFVYGDPRRAGSNGGNAGVTFGVNTGWTSADANLTDQVGWLYDSIFTLGQRDLRRHDPQ